MSFHAEAIRPQFPSLNPPGTDGALPIFLDNPAGTQVPLRVMQAATEYYMTMNANSGGAFATSQRSDRMARRTRESVADFLNAPDAAEIVIGPNMTTLSFSLSRSIARLLAPGDEIVLTRLDHDANVAPWLHIAGERGLKIKWVDIHAAGLRAGYGFAGGGARRTHPGRGNGACLQRRRHAHSHRANRGHGACGRRLAYRRRRAKRAPRAY